MERATNKAKARAHRLAAMHTIFQIPVSISGKIKSFQERCDKPSRRAKGVAVNGNGVGSPISRVGTLRGHVIFMRRKEAAFRHSDEEAIATVSAKGSEVILGVLDARLGEERAGVGSVVRQDKPITSRAIAICFYVELCVSTIRSYPKVSCRKNRGTAATTSRAQGRIIGFSPVDLNIGSRTARGFQAARDSSKGGHAFLSVGHYGCKPTYVLSVLVLFIA